MLLRVKLCLDYTHCLAMKYLHIFFVICIGQQSTNLCRSTLPTITGQVQAAVVLVRV